MKFALACDSSNVDSYLVQNEKVYTFDGEPYYRHHHIKNECMMGFWNYPALFDGYFINLREAQYPKEDFDIIFAAIESDIGYLEILKKLYPKAKILGTLKEAVKRADVRNRLIEETEAFVIPYLTYNYFERYGYTVPKKFFRIPQPINIDYLKNKFSSKLKEQVFDYSNDWAGGRRGANSQLLQNIEYPSVHKRNSNWENFINMWKGSKYMINLDPTPNFGQQGTQCAALGTIMVGGVNDSHKVLFPDLASCNVEELVNTFKRLEADNTYYSTVLSFASEKVKEVYSFEAVRKLIANL